MPTKILRRRDARENKIRVSAIQYCAVCRSGVIDEIFERGGGDKSRRSIDTVHLQII